MSCPKHDRQIIVGLSGAGGSCGQAGVVRSGQRQVVEAGSDHAGCAQRA